MMDNLVSFLIAALIIGVFLFYHLKREKKKRPGNTSRRGKRTTPFRWTASATSPYRQQFLYRLRHVHDRLPRRGCIGDGRRKSHDHQRLQMHRP